MSVSTMTTDTISHVGRGKPQGMIQINAYMNDIYRWLGKAVWDWWDSIGANRGKPLPMMLVLIVLSANVGFWLKMFCNSRIQFSLVSFRHPVLDGGSYQFETGLKFFLGRWTSGQWVWCSKVKKKKCFLQLPCFAWPASRTIAFGQLFFLSIHLH